MRREAALFAIATVLVGYGVFGFDRSGATTWPSYYAGLLLMAVGLVLLLRAAWRSGPRAWLVGAAAASVAIWTFYELVRQSGCPLLGEGSPSWRACIAAYGPMTAPVLSFGAGALVLLVGWLARRRRSSRDIHQR